MKVPPLNLNPDMSRVRLPLHFNPDLLWRYPIPLHPNTAPSSPLLEVKNQMPAQLPADPRLWSREDVVTFLRWFEREFELPEIDTAKLYMNGKALCMLTKTDLADRVPGAGDILHNTLQFLLRDAPPSPLTPHPLLSPSPLTNPSQPWPLMGSELHTLGHLLQQGGSVTLSPAHSDQSGGSPRQNENMTAIQNFQSSNNSSGSGSAHSDSDDSIRDNSSPQRSPVPPPPQPIFSAQALASLKHLTDYRRAAAAAAAVSSAALPHEDKKPHITQSSFSLYQPPHSTAAVVSQTQSSHVPHFDDEPVETGSNGRLLWDFLQQLLNDPKQRYVRHIAWKNKDTGVFKIVDPPGLARLWGIQKNHLSMNYDKMSRALRYYYRVNILRKVQGERHCYQFLRSSSDLKNIKNLSLLRGAPIPHSQKWDNTSLQSLTPMEEGPPTLLPQKWETHNLIDNKRISAPLRKWELTPISSAQAGHSMEDGPTDLSMTTISNSNTILTNSVLKLSNAEGNAIFEPQNLTMTKSEIKSEPLT